jgi:DNA-binding FadR family transcriptional regulator
MTSPAFASYRSGSADELSRKTYTRELSWDFHALLATAAHNGALASLTQSFRGSLSMHPIRTREGAAAYARTVEEHARILAALELRDAARARSEMAHHLLRGTNLEQRESDLLALWDARGTDEGPGARPGPS